MVVGSHWLEQILGPEHQFSLDKRLLNAALFSTVAASLLLSITDYLQGLGLRFVLTSISIFLLSALLFVIGRRGRGGQWLVWALLGLLGAALVWFWFGMGGFLGATPILSVAMATAIPALLDGSRRWLALLLLVGLLSGLFVIQYRVPGVIQAYPDIRAHQRDIYFTLVLICGAVSLMMSLVVYSYQRQRLAARELNRELQHTNDQLGLRNRELVQAFDEIVVLRGIIPICAHCKKVRNDEGFYEAVESYIHRHSEADFSHTICPDCLHSHYPEDGPGAA